MKIILAILMLSAAAWGENKPLSRTVVGPSKSIAPMGTNGKCPEWKLEMKGVQPGDRLSVVFADDPSKEKVWRDGSLNVNVEAASDAFWFSVCNPTSRPITPTIATFLVVDVDRNMP